MFTPYLWLGYSLSSLSYLGLAQGFGVTSQQQFLSVCCDSWPWRLTWSEHPWGLLKHTDVDFMRAHMYKCSWICLTCCDLWYQVYEAEADPSKEVSDVRHNRWPVWSVQILLEGYLLFSKLRMGSENHGNSFETAGARSSTRQLVDDGSKAVFMGAKLWKRGREVVIRRSVLKDGIGIDCTKGPLQFLENISLLAKAVMGWPRWVNHMHHLPWWKQFWNCKETDECSMPGRSWGMGATQSD